MEIRNVDHSLRQVEVRVMAGSCHLVHDELAQRATFLDEVQRFLERLG